MAPPPLTKPENVMKRAQELVGVGQSQAALSLLHEHLTAKRTRNNPISSIEPAMIYFVDLCVELKKGKAAKDALYSYKNTAQNTNISTIELVLTKFIEGSEAKASEAQAKAEQVPTVDDLEASETPESILLSTVSGEQSRDRTDRAIVTPWLKFLWETYRTVLDILKNNARLETMYQSTAHRAFSFCSKHARKTEFRRLCELLRNHLQNAAKYQAQVHAINLSDPETLQRHLDTRFLQLNVAVELELWQEAFRSIEDIHALLSLSKRPARNVMMVNYFEKLAAIFLRSENYLYHAAAVSRVNNLYRTAIIVIASGQGSKKDNPAVTDADLTDYASFVILSALSIPVISTSRSRGALDDVDETRKNRNARLSSLIGANAAPSRATLLKDALNKGLLKRARPEIRELYNILEVDFHPLSICKKISPILSKIGGDEQMGKYVAPLQQVILTRLFQQLSQVYESVELEYVISLADFPEPYQISRQAVEKFIMNGCKKGDLAIRINHSTGVLTFDADVFSAAKALHPGSGSGSAESETGTVQRLQSTPAEIVRSQLVRLAKTLYTTCTYVDPSFSEDQRKARALALQRAEQNANTEHMDTLERRGIIERKKQAASTALAQKEKEEATRKRLRAQQQQEAELQRLENEQRERDQKRLRDQQLRVQREEAAKQLDELKQSVKVDLGDIDLDDLDTAKIRQIKLQQLEKEKSELASRMQVTSKRVDHLERAMRREEAKHMPEDYQAQLKRDREEYDEITAQTLQEAQEKHTSDVALKNRLMRLVPAYEDFRDRKRTERRADFERRRKVAEKELEQKKQARVREHHERKAREKREREERERAEREAEERARVEAEEEERRAEEKKRRDAERRAKQEEERRKLDEIAEKQRQREAEAEQRRKEKAPGPPSRFAERAPPAESAPAPSARPAVAGLKPGGWREREAARRAAGGDSADGPPAPPTMDERTSSSRGGYVPPGARGGRTMDDRAPAGEREGSRPYRPAGGGFGRRGDGASPAPPVQRNESPAPPPGDGAPAGGKYRPGMFRQQRGN